jgi:hypothetical protein
MTMIGSSGMAIIAVVHALDGVRFATTGGSREAVMIRLARYVRERCDDVLSADAGGRVRALLAVGNLTAAIAVYFERVGERWDDERLELFTAEGDGIRWTSDDEILSDARR